MCAALSHDVNTPDKRLSGKIKSIQLWSTPKIEPLEQADFYHWSNHLTRCWLIIAKGLKKVKSHQSCADHFWLTNSMCKFLYLNNHTINLLTKIPSWRLLLFKKGTVVTEVESSWNSRFTFILRHIYSDPGALWSTRFLHCSSTETKSVCGPPWTSPRNTASFRTLHLLISPSTLKVLPCFNHHWNLQGSSTFLTCMEPTHGQSFQPSSHHKSGKPNFFTLLCLPKPIFHLGITNWSNFSDLKYCWTKSYDPDDWLQCKALSSKFSSLPIKLFSATPSPTNSYPKSFPLLSKHLTYFPGN